MVKSPLFSGEIHPFFLLDPGCAMAVKSTKVSSHDAVCPVGVASKVGLWTFQEDLRHRKPRWTVGHRIGDGWWGCAAFGSYRIPTTLRLTHHVMLKRCVFAVRSGHCMEGKRRHWLPCLGRLGPRVGGGLEDGQPRSRSTAPSGKNMTRF